MLTKMIPIDELIPYERNAKLHPEEQIAALAAMFLEFGFDQNIVVDSDNVIIKGHGRRLAAIRAGYKSVPCTVRTDLTAAQIRASRVADNKIAETDWDEEKLNSELKIIEQEDAELLKLLGIEEKELAERLKSDENNWGDKDPDEIPEVPQNVRGVERGQIWQLGDHRMMCGDSTSKDDVERLMGGEKADMVFTDPPYGISFQSNQEARGRRKNEFAVIENDEKPFDPTKILVFFDYVDEIFIWGANNFANCLPVSSWICWDRKGTEVMDRSLPGDFDLCWSKKRHKMQMIRVIWSGAFGHSKKDDGDKKVHPTMKPVKLAIEFFDRWGKEAKLVWDGFLGSGSTLIACEKTNRKCFGMEIDPHYCSVIIERFEKFSGKKAELIEPSPHVFADGSIQFDNGDK